jgi:hypothetical protein
VADAAAVEVVEQGCDEGGAGGLPADDAVLFVQAQQAPVGIDVLFGEFEGGSAAAGGFGV